MTTTEIASVAACNIREGDVLVDGEFRSTVTSTNLTRGGRVTIKFITEGVPGVGRVTRSDFERFNVARVTA